MLAYRQIGLNKNPGICWIGVGEFGRRSIAKAVMSIPKGHIQDPIGTKNLCAGQISGVETVVHSVRKMSDHKEIEAVLLMDDSNPFNSLNRQVAIQYIKRLYPSLATILINTYKDLANYYRAPSLCCHLCLCWKKCYMTFNRRPYLGADIGTTRV